MESLLYVGTAAARAGGQGCRMLPGLSVFNTPTGAILRTKKGIALINSGKILASPHNPTLKVKFGLYFSSDAVFTEGPKPLII